MALSGLGARRKCEAYVSAGEVTVNGQIVQDLGRQVDLGADRVEFRGVRVRAPESVYFMLHKPEGYATTAGDPFAKRTVFELLPRKLGPLAGPGAAQTRVFPVGRLDQDSEGLLLFTNDGDLANRLTHPRYGISKDYEVKINRPFNRADEVKLLKGVWLEEGRAKFDKVRILSNRILQVTLREGKKREVRRVLVRVGYKVIQLVRISFGPLKLGDLAVGQGRFLKAQEVEALRAAK